MSPTSQAELQETLQTLWEALSSHSNHVLKLSPINYICICNCSTPLKWDKDNRTDRHIWINQSKSEFHLRRVEADVFVLCLGGLTLSVCACQGQTILLFASCPDTSCLLPNSGNRLRRLPGSTPRLDSRRDQNALHATGFLFHVLIVNEFK